ncbi:hypothetical protein ILUMI_12027, partial [Ignelater luminosus]
AEESPFSLKGPNHYRASGASSNLPSNEGRPSSPYVVHQMDQRYQCSPPQQQDAQHKTSGRSMRYSTMESQEQLARRLREIIGKRLPKEDQLQNMKPSHPQTTPPTARSSAGNRGRRPKGSVLLHLATSLQQAHHHERE